MYTSHNYILSIDVIRTNPNIRTILPAMQYLNQSLVTILKELKAVKYTLGPVAVCVGCKEEKLLKYITYTDHKSDIADKLKCSSCASYEPISITTKAVISKVIYYLIIFCVML